MFCPLLLMFMTDLKQQRTALLSDRHHALDTICEEEREEAFVVLYDNIATSVVNTLTTSPEEPVEEESGGGPGSGAGACPGPGRELHEVVP